MKKIVILTGAGISAESGIKTFRDSDGLWEEHRIEDVATYEAWLRNPLMVQEFYNQRRKQLYEVAPNLGHYALVDLEKKYNVQIITQNVDDLHERAGTKNILHLHGQLKQSKSTIDNSLIYDIDGWELKMGDLCEKGSQLRPNIVWFGEAVPNIVTAAEISSKADIYIVIGTSLKVYPAAGLMGYASSGIPKYLVDPSDIETKYYSNLKQIKEKASIGVPLLVEKLLLEA